MTSEVFNFVECKFIVRMENSLIILLKHRCECEEELSRLLTGLSAESASKKKRSPGRRGHRSRAERKRNVRGPQSWHCR
jgi:hypothetical protein